MKNIISLVGILLIILGIASLAYNGITYNKQEKIAQFGEVQITSNTKKTINIPPLAGGVSIAAGIILVFLSRRKD